METPVEQMNVGDFADFQRRLGLRVIQVHGLYWREVRPFFYRPLLLFRDHSADFVDVPPGARLGGCQFLVPPDEPGNSSIEFLEFSNPQGYSIATLDYNRKRQVKLASNQLIIRRILNVDEFKEKAYPVFNAFYDRTHFSFQPERRHKHFFCRWADDVFGTVANLVLGAYLEDELGAVSISQWVEDTFLYSTYFATNQFLRLHASDFMLHSVRQIAAGCSGLKRVFAGLYRGGNGHDNFYLLRGCDIVSRRALLQVNPLSALLLRCFAPVQYRRLWGRPQPDGSGLSAKENELVCSSVRRP